MFFFSGSLSSSWLLPYFFPNGSPAELHQGALLNALHQVSGEAGDLVSLVDSL